MREIWLGLPGNFRGIIWLTVGVFILSGVNVLVKILGSKFHAIEIAFFRYLVGFIILSPVFVRMGWEQLRTERLPLHLMRMSLAFVGQVLVFLSVIYLPLADATAFMFTKPIFTAVAAVLILHEAVTKKRWFLTALGFGGVLIMLRPGSDGIDFIALIAVIAAAIWGTANVLIRMLSTTEPTTRILFYYHVGGVVVFLGPALWFWQSPTNFELMLLVAIGGGTTACMFCYFRAFAVGEANAVAPAEYTGLVYAALLGFFIFAELPSIWVASGALVIIGSTYFIARDESKIRSIAENSETTR
ncbi:MAG: Riboflavin transporter [Alphaproteobacteria bacterium MarineAlpha11_Bin1]|nr:MAG: Riboflavin transporter [Alphaproteobacteria bacterium MarineAlpha11_Bin1]|tara:strand:+ start:5706 stop:6608 length:903 start_codon:yes stop_codon:yes gene_type:complete